MLIVCYSFKFSPSGIYHVPLNTEYEDILKYIQSLPLAPHPEVFGLHENADITKDNKETKLVLYSFIYLNVEEKRLLKA